MNPKILHRKEAAKMLGVHLNTIANMNRRGELPFIQISVNRVGIALDDLMAHIANNRQTQSA